MQIRFSKLPPETLFQGTKQDFALFANALRQTEAFFTDVEMEYDPAPYKERALGVRIEAWDDSKVVISFDELKNEINIGGDPKWMNMLAENIANLSNQAKTGYHIHIEYFEGHFYLASNSVPTVCRVI